MRALRRTGMATSSFGYAAALQDFASIERRLRMRVERLARGGPYVLVGHSLGGVLLRSTLASLGADVRPPEHLFLLGSPTQAARLALRLGHLAPFRALTGDCGQLLGSPDRMARVQARAVRTTAIVGTRSLPLQRAFGDEPNDGVVSVSEVSAAWLSDQVQVPVQHTFLPSSPRVSAIILDRLGRSAR